MNICLDMSPAVYGRGGIGRYAEQLLGALTDLAPAHAYWGLCNAAGGCLPKSDGSMAFRPFVVPWDNKSWRLRVAAAHLWQRSQDNLLPRMDVFHGTDNLLPHLTRIRSVFTVHDVAFRAWPGTDTLPNRLYLQTMMPVFLRHADTVICDSEWTRNDVARLFHVPDRKLKVVYPGVSPRFIPVLDTDRICQIRERFALPELFVLCVGTLEPRKNVPTLIRAFRQAAVPGLGLVLVGRRGWHDAPIRAALQESGSEGSIRVLERVTDEDLPVLYSMALATVLPSWYEGFGFPVVESMACGTPVVCSSAASLPEVAGDAALQVAPQDVGGWATAIRTVVDQPALRRELRDKGFRQASRFSAESMARAMLSAYEALA